MRFQCLLVCAVLLCLCFVGANADVPKFISFQGSLSDSSGPVSGSRTMLFSLYADSTGGDALWDELHWTVELSDGLFSVLLGTIDTLRIELFDGQLLWVEIVVQGETLSPRVALSSNPYSFRSENASFATKSDSAEFAVYADTALWALGGVGGISSDTVNFAFWADSASWADSAFHTVYSDTADKAYHAMDADSAIHAAFSDTALYALNGAGEIGWSLNGNSGTSPTYNFLGTTDDQALEFRVNNTRALRLEPNVMSPNFIGGFNGNNVFTGVYGATIGGGGNNDYPNSVLDYYGTVGGGYINTAGEDLATVGGGAFNTADGVRSTVGGGWQNQAGGFASTIGGGCGNLASGETATVGGGNYNTAAAEWATVGGGSNNQATGTLSTISGGDINHAYSDYTSIGGGVSNDALNEYATVGGGFSNTASGQYATIPGGRGNSASGGYSFAAGWRARAIHSGSFVWGDSTNLVFSSTAPNQFLIRASGGVGIGTDSPTAALHVEGDMCVTGQKNALVPSSQGMIKYYCEESTEVWFSDYGRDRLTNGFCHVELDPLFLETVTITEENTIFVFLQEEGECQGLFVTPGLTGFDVQEKTDGASDIVFSYRVVARRRGYEDERLAIIGGSDE